MLASKVLLTLLPLPLYRPWNTIPLHLIWGFAKPCPDSPAETRIKFEYKERRKKEEEEKKKRRRREEEEKGKVAGPPSKYLDSQRSMY
jgi:hypothetical protein